MTTFGRTVTIPRRPGEARSSSSSLPPNTLISTTGPPSSQATAGRVREDAPAGQRRERAGDVAAVGPRADEDELRARRARAAPAIRSAATVAHGVVRGGRLRDREDARQVRARAPSRRPSGRRRRRSRRRRWPAASRERPGERRDLRRDLGEATVGGHLADRPRWRRPSDDPPLGEERRRPRARPRPVPRGRPASRPAAAAPRRRGPSSSATAPPTRRRVDADVGQRLRHDLLRAGGHDPLERRVARLAEGLGADDRAGIGASRTS